MRRLTALLSVGLILFAGPAFAEGGEEAGFMTAIYHAINLALFIGLIVYFGGKGISRAMRGRSEAVGKDITDASKLHEEAQALLDEWQGKVGALEAERAQLLERYREEGEAERARLIAEGEAESQRIVRETERLMENELERAKAQIEAEIVDISIRLAEEQLRKKVGVAEQRQLTSNYLAGLEEIAQG